MTKTPLANIIAYIVDRYPHKGELSNARVTKMIYLADWFSLINGKEPVSNIAWYFDNYGPFVWDIKRAAEESRMLKVESRSTIFGNKKEVIALADNVAIPEISADVQLAINHIIAETKPLSWAAFIQLVYSTYPVAHSQKYTQLDLPSLAREYVANQRK